MRRQLPKQQKMHDLFVGCVHGEIVDIVAAVREPPDLPLNVTEHGLPDDDALETTVNQYACHAAHFGTSRRAPVSNRTVFQPPCVVGTRSALFVLRRTLRNHQAAFVSKRRQTTSQQPPRRDKTY